MRKMTFSKWDRADYLKTEDDIKMALKVAFKDYDEAAFKLLLRDIIKARSRMTTTAKATGIPRTTLYRQLSSKANLTLKNFVKIEQSLGLNFFNL